MRKSITRLFIVLITPLLLAGCGDAATEGTESNSQQTESNAATESVLETETATQTEAVTETESVTEAETVTETESESMIETETEPEPSVTTFTISAVGDCAIGALQTHGYSGSFHQYYDKNGESYFFQNFKELFETDDVTLVNLEGVLTDETNRVEKNFNIKGYPEYAGILTSSSIEACSLGNNHTQDYGKASLTDTQEALTGAGVLYAYNDTVAYYTTQDGIKVAMLSTSLFSKSKEKYLLNGIEKAREEGADLIIASCHWGKERVYYPTSYQQEAAHRLIDAGADLVIGHHPHVLQGIEYYKGKVICYSLGNFCFGANRNPDDKNTIVFQQTFTFVDGELQEDVDARIIPSRVSGKNNSNNYQPIIATGEQAMDIIDKMNEYSSPYSEVSFDKEGNLIINE